MPTQQNQTTFNLNLDAKGARAEIQQLNNKLAELYRMLTAGSENLEAAVDGVMTRALTFGSAIEAMTKKFGNASEIVWGEQLEEARLNIDQLVARYKDLLDVQQRLAKYQQEVPGLTVGPTGGPERRSIANTAGLAKDMVASFGDEYGGMFEAIWARNKEAMLDSLKVDSRGRVNMQRFAESYKEILVKELASEEGFMAEALNNQLGAFRDPEILAGIEGVFKAAQGDARLLGQAINVLSEEELVQLESRTKAAQEQLAAFRMQMRDIKQDSALAHKSLKQAFDTGDQEQAHQALSALSVELQKLARIRDFDAGQVPDKMQQSFRDMQQTASLAFNKILVDNEQLIKAVSGDEIKMSFDGASKAIGLSATKLKEYAYTFRDELGGAIQQQGNVITGITQAGALLAKQKAEQQHYDENQLRVRTEFQAITQAMLANEAEYITMLQTMGVEWKKTAQYAGDFYDTLLEQSGKANNMARMLNVQMSKLGEAFNKDSVYANTLRGAMAEVTQIGQAMGRMVTAAGKGILDEKDIIGTENRLAGLTVQLQAMEQGISRLGPETKASMADLMTNISSLADQLGRLRQTQESVRIEQEKMVTDGIQRSLDGYREYVTGIDNVGQAFNSLKTLMTSFRIRSVEDVGAVADNFKIFGTQAGRLFAMFKAGWGEVAVGVAKTLVGGSVAVAEQSNIFAKALSELSGGVENLGLRAGAASYSLVNVAKSLEEQARHFDRSNDDLKTMAKGNHELSKSLDIVTNRMSTTLSMTRGLYSGALSGRDVTSELTNVLANLDSALGEVNYSLESNKTLTNEQRQVLVNYATALKIMRQEVFKGQRVHAGARKEIESYRTRTQQVVDAVKKAPQALKAAAGGVKDLGSSFVQAQAQAFKFNTTLDNTNSLMGSVFKGALLGYLAGRGIEAMARSLRNLGGFFVEANTAYQDFEALLSGLIAGRGGFESVADRMETISRESEQWFRWAKAIIVEAPFEIVETVGAIPRMMRYQFNPQDWLYPMVELASAFGKNVDEVNDAVYRMVQGTQNWRKSMLSLGVPLHQVGGWVRYLADGTLRAADYSEVFDEVSGNLKEGLEEQGYVYKKLVNSNNELIESARDSGEVLRAWTMQSSSVRGAAREMAKTFSGVVSNLKDTLGLMSVEIGRPIFTRLAAALTTFLTFLNRSAPFVEGVLGRLGNAIGQFIDRTMEWIKGMASVRLAFYALWSALDSLARNDFKATLRYLVIMFAGALRTIGELISGFAAAIASLLRGTRDVKNRLSSMAEEINALMVADQKKKKEAEEAGEELGQALGQGIVEGVGQILSALTALDVKEYMELVEAAGKSADKHVENVASTVKSLVKGALSDEMQTELITAAHNFKKDMLRALSVEGGAVDYKALAEQYFGRFVAPVEALFDYIEAAVEAIRAGQALEALEAHIKEAKKLRDAEMKAMEDQIKGVRDQVKALNDMKSDADRQLELIQREIQARVDAALAAMDIFIDEDFIRRLQLQIDMAKDESSELNDRLEALVKFRERMGSRLMTQEEVMLRANKDLAEQRIKDMEAALRAEQLKVKKRDLLELDIAKGYKAQIESLEKQKFNAQEQLYDLNKRLDQLETYKDGLKETHDKQGEVEDAQLETAKELVDTTEQTESMLGGALSQVKTASEEMEDAVVGAFFKAPDMVKELFDWEGYFADAGVLLEAQKQSVMTTLQQSLNTFFNALIDVVAVAIELLMGLLGSKRGLGLPTSMGFARTVDTSQDEDYQKWLKKYGLKEDGRYDYYSAYRRGETPNFKHLEMRSFPGLSGALLPEPFPEQFRTGRDTAPGEKLSTLFNTLKEVSDNFKISDEYKDYSTAVQKIPALIDGMAEVVDALRSFLRFFGWGKEEEPHFGSQVRAEWAERQFQKRMQAEYSWFPPIDDPWLPTRSDLKPDEAGKEMGKSFTTETTTGITAAAGSMFGGFIANAPSWISSFINSPELKSLSVSSLIPEPLLQTITDLHAEWGGLTEKTNTVSLAVDVKATENGQTSTLGGLISSLQTLVGLGNVGSLPLLQGIGRGNYHVQPVTSMPAPAGVGFVYNPIINVQGSLIGDDLDNLLTKQRENFKRTMEEYVRKQVRT